jgi:hypothetical protein
MWVQSHCRAEQKQDQYIIINKCVKKIYLFITYINVNVLNKKTVEKQHCGTRDESDGQSDRHGLHIPCSDYLYQHT